MKRTNRQKNSIIVWFLFSLWITILSIYFVIYNIVPSIKNIEKQKEETKILQDRFEEISKKGLSFEDFNSLKGVLDSKDEDIQDVNYLKKLISKLDKDFFETSFTNTWSIHYGQFLIKKEKELEQENNVSSSIKKDLMNILPNYSSNSLIFKDEEVLTDFKFINFLEELFDSFDLEYTWDLWIKNLANYDNDGWDLDTSIFYIPLEFKVSWKKFDIINFLHYFENVWYIKINDNQLGLYMDDFIYSNFWAKVLVGDNKYSEDYNIYNNQLADISEIKMVDYIDSSYKIRDKETTFTDFIKQDLGQKNEKYEIQIWIRFYTLWAQNYKIREYIEKVLTNYNGLLSAVSSKLKNADLVRSKESKDLILLNKLKDLNEYLLTFKKEVANIKKKLAKAEDLNGIYKEVLKYDTIIDNSLVILWEDIYKKQ